MSDNDRIGYLTIPVNEFIQVGDQADVLPTLPVADGVQNDPDLKDYIRPIVIDESIGDNIKATAEGAQFRFLAKFVPYTVLRKRFWYGLAMANGIDDPQGPYSKVLIQNMLEGLGSTVCEETIDGFFKKYNKTPEQGLDFDELYECLEQRIKLADGEAAKNPETPFYKKLFRRSKAPHGDQGDQSLTTSHTHEHEQVIRISTCPICNDPSLREKLETDVITHIAVCAGNDGFNLDKLIMSEFGTEANARRKSITKFIKSLGYGKYIVGEVRKGATPLYLVDSFLDNRVTDTDLSFVVLGYSVRVTPTSLFRNVLLARELKKRCQPPFDWAFDCYTRAQRTR
jgi:phosphatidylserine decarboxylase